MGFPFPPHRGVFVRRPHPAMSHRARPGRLGRVPTSHARQAGLESVPRGRRGSPAHETPPEEEQGHTGRCTWR